MSTLNQAYKIEVKRLCSGEIDQSQFLDWLYNKMGAFKVQLHTQNRKKDYMSGWVDWLEIRARKYNEHYNHRNICIAEIVFDLDLPGWLMEHERLAIVKATVRRLKSFHAIHPVVFDTGKGYHLHWFDQENAVRHFQDTKRDYAESVIKDVRSDLMKWNSNTMIAIEYSRHWKRNNRVRMIEV